MGARAAGEFGYERNGNPEVDGHSGLRGPRLAKGSQHLFAFGHKPTLAAPGGDGLRNGGSLWDVPEANYAEAMLAAHNHLYHRSQQPSYHPCQLIAGNGGRSSTPAPRPTSSSPATSW